MIMVNGGRMPVWMDAYAFAGLTGRLNSVLHVPLYDVNAEFFLRLGPLADVIPLPIPPFQNVASIGDLFLSAGLGFFLFATLLRTPAEAQRALDEAREDRLAGRQRDRPPPRTRRRIRPARRRRSRPAPASARRSRSRPRSNAPSSSARRAPARPHPRSRSPAGRHARRDVDRGATAAASGIRSLTRVRRHPYVRLALNGSFSALWVGQLISMFGDRVNQIALLFFVFEIDEVAAPAWRWCSSRAASRTSSSRPVAGALVDRWDQKQVLVVSDILRAALVLLVPVTISINVWLAYVIVFLITTVSIFFRPARIAILPRLVDDADLLPANSAMWVGETIADVVNYPLAGLFVAVPRQLGGARLLVRRRDLPRLGRSCSRRWSCRRSSAARGRRRRWASRSTSEPEPTTGGVPTVADVRRDLKEGWGFLRTEAALLANTRPEHGRAVRGRRRDGPRVPHRGADQSRRPSTATFAFMETAIGVGNLLGGFALGLVTARIAKGRLIIAAYTVFGVLVFLVGFIPPLPIMLGLMFGIGIANMAFVIPSQTLFQERTPPELMARVVSFRFAIVFGVMTIATASLGLVANVTGVGPVVALAGLIAIVAGSRATSCRPSATRDGTRSARDAATLATLSAA